MSERGLSSLGSECPREGGVVGRFVLDGGVREGGGVSEGEE